MHIIDQLQASMSYMGLGVSIGLAMALYVLQYRSNKDDADDLCS